MPTGITNFL